MGLNVGKRNLPVLVNVEEEEEDKEENSQSSES